jgi:prephenate dehydrogenase
MEVLIVGAGEMGRWFGETVDANVVFSDIDSDAAAAAADAVGGRAVASLPDDQFAAVCIAVPMAAAEDAIAEYADRATEAVVDVTGSMADPVAAMATHAPNVERASLHPLFAAENAPGNVAVVRDAEGPVTDALLEDLAAAGNEVFETTPAEHDEAMATVQAGAHTAVLAYALAAERVPEQFQTPISAGLLDLVEQVTGNSPHVYAEIQSTFDGAEDVAAAARRIADADDEAFERLYAEGHGVLETRPVSTDPKEGER